MCEWMIWNSSSPCGIRPELSLDQILTPEHEEKLKIKRNKNALRAFFYRLQFFNKFCSRCLWLFQNRNENKQRVFFFNAIFFIRSCYQICRSWWDFRRKRQLQLPTENSLCLQRYSIQAGIRQTIQWLRLTLPQTIYFRDRLIFEALPYIYLMNYETHYVQLVNRIIFGSKDFIPRVWIYIIPKTNNFYLLLRPNLAISTFAIAETYERYLPFISTSNAPVCNNVLSIVLDRKNTDIHETI